MTKQELEISNHLIDAVKKLRPFICKGTEFTGLPDNQKKDKEKIAHLMLEIYYLTCELTGDENMYPINWEKIK